MKHPPQEHDQVPGRKIAYVGSGVIAATVVSCLIAYGIAACMTRSITGLGTERGAPREVADVNAIERAPYAVEAQGLEANRRAEAFLATYGWVDRDREIVHVPIEVAIELYLSGRRPGAPAGGTP